MAAMVFCEMRGHWHFAMHNMESDIILDGQTDPHTDTHVQWPCTTTHWVSALGPPEPAAHQTNALI